MALLDMAARDVPEGTRPDRYSYVVVRGGLLERSISDVRRQLERELGEPFIVVVYQANALAADERPPMLDRLDPFTPWLVVFGFTYRAIPGKTKWVVIRAAHDLPAGMMPAEWEGRLIPRADVPAAGVPVTLHISGAGLETKLTAVLAKATGEVEMHGAKVAEVYEVARPS
ncbi:hypothetical protein ETD86_29440 [Nonomuraea turkmeniaca]|uniref:Uncharacterized protein n=1 Tax=Nonomuraea turkmeniaca TaxID=103838 RepID=A0A5S4FA96_9ACTN|nr:hypothetical protein [Nonomuraea turkmeniaca]TMR14072.1 hypothetical protein ETD86_29440 [Nonomuraea turkmeniaca]